MLRNKYASLFDKSHVEVAGAGRALNLPAAALVDPRTLSRWPVDL